MWMWGWTGHALYSGTLVWHTQTVPGLDSTSLPLLHCQTHTWCHLALVYMGHKHGQVSHQEWHHFWEPAAVDLNLRTWASRVDCTFCTYMHDMVLWWSIHENCHALYGNFVQSCKENRTPSMRGDKLCFTFAMSWNIPVLYYELRFKERCRSFITQEAICLTGWKPHPTEIELYIRHYSLCCPLMSVLVYMNALVLSYVAM